MQPKDIFALISILSVLVIALMAVSENKKLWKKSDRQSRDIMALYQKINDLRGGKNFPEFGCFFTAMPALDIERIAEEPAEEPDGAECWPNIGDKFYAHCDNCDFYTLVTSYRDWTVADGSSKPPRCLCDICACTSLASVTDDPQLSGVAKSMAFLFNVVISGTGSRSILENNLETGLEAGASFRLVNFDESTEVQIISDGFGNFAFKFCPKCGGEVHPVRPGKFQCTRCD